MIKYYDLKFWDAPTVDDSVLYERYVDQIAQVLEDSGIFTSVVKIKNDPEAVEEYQKYHVKAYVGDDMVAEFRLGGATTTQASSYKVLNHHYFDLVYANGLRKYSIRPTSFGNYYTGIGFRKAYVTSNGIIFQFNIYSIDNTNHQWGAIIIAKSNKSHPVIIAPNNGVQGIRGSVVACHSYEVITACYTDDNVSISKGQYSGSQCNLYNYNTTAKQSMMFPFTAYGSPNGDYTYSKYALWIPFAPANVRNAGFQKALVNDKAYVIDGYFALRDD